MAYRSFTDRDGIEWQVWDVLPNSTVRHTLSGGWLTFESAEEKRRLAPVPLYWVSAEDDELERLMRTAAVVPRRDAPARDASPPERHPPG